MAKMSLDVMKNFLTNSTGELASKKQRFNLSEKYYLNQNDIVGDTSVSALEAMINHNSGNDKLPKSQKDLLHNADNRVSSNFHQIIVDQEAGYLATVDPVIDVGNDSDNTRIKEILGDDFSLTLNQLVIDAANAGYSWLHYWVDDKKNFHFAVVSPSEIYPIYSNSLETDLKGVERVYQQINTDTGKYETIVEYWDDTTCTTFKKVDSSLDYYNMFEVTDIATNAKDLSCVYNHNWGRVPFIKFSKNIKEKPELKKYKGTIDIYDKVYNGFANDLDDIQQTILILKGYGGQKISDLWNTIKENKAIPIDIDPTGNDSGGVETLNIEIPTEARKIMLEVSRQKIFDEGQGIDPQKFMDNGALSGKAVKGLYANLELKASTTEKYFRPALAQLIRAIMQHLNISDYKNCNISQKWTRTAIQDDLERSQILANVAPYTSKRNLANGNPLVDDSDAELEYQKDDEVNGDGYGDQSQVKKLSEEPNKDEIDE